MIGYLGNRRNSIWNPQAPKLDPSGNYNMPDPNQMQPQMQMPQMPMMGSNSLAPSPEIMNKYLSPRSQAPQMGMVRPRQNNMMRGSVRRRMF